MKAGKLLPSWSSRCRCQCHGEQLSNLIPLLKDAEVWLGVTPAEFRLLEKTPQVISFAMLC